MTLFGDSFMGGRTGTAAILIIAAALGAGGGAPVRPYVDISMLDAGERDGVNWLNYGRTADEARFSPLVQINTGNINKLGLAWYADLDTQRGQEATSIVVDGTLYVSTAWSMVKAFDAATGALRWSYDPQVPRETLVKACCDAVNRGVAVWHDKVYVATLDGRLIALAAASGMPVWTTRMFDEASPHTSTGAPRIVKGKVIIGNGGAEYIVRGSVSAYNAETGKRVWQFYTVPGNPAVPFENKALARAAKTWTGEWWKLGGGGTVWDSITYDAKLDLLFFGTGNGGPWNATVRSPGGGDNLYTSSIVAVRPDTGEYIWHFQENPTDRWDFDATQQIIAATVTIDGRTRRVLYHAPKNGFFYVLDAATGKFLSGKPFTTVNWTSGLDPATGRPVELAAASYDRTGKMFVGVPGAAGAHSWQPMSYSSATGLVYIPVNEAAFPYAASATGWKPSSLGFNTGLDSAAVAMPADAKARAGARAATTGALLAWDPVKQKAAWRVALVGPSNGGVLSTAGNLVFQGTAAGDFKAYSADHGQLLWSRPVQTGVIAAPMTYSVGGQQYVAILAGWGGIWDIGPGVLSNKSGTTRNISRLLVFKLGGTEVLPPPAPAIAIPLDPPPVTASAATIHAGAALYGRYCSTCHGDAAVAGGLNPDLRHSGMINSAVDFRKIVIDGLLGENGMVSFTSVMSPVEVDTIRHYLIRRANEDKILEANPGLQ